MRFFVSPFTICMKPNTSKMSMVYVRSCNNFIKVVVVLQTEKLWSPISWQQQLATTLHFILALPPAFLYSRSTLLASESQTELPTTIASISMISNNCLALWIFGSLDQVLNIIEKKRDEKILCIPIYETMILENALLDTIITK